MSVSVPSFEMPSFAHVSCGHYSSSPPVSLCTKFKMRSFTRNLKGGHMTLTSVYSWVIILSAGDWTWSNCQPNLKCLALQVKPGIQQVQAVADISRSALRCHSNETRAPISNLPNSTQLEGSSYHSPSYIRVRAVVRDRQTQRRPWSIYTSPRLCLTRNVNTRRVPKPECDMLLCWSSDGGPRSDEVSGWKLIPVSAMTLLVWVTWTASDP